MPIRVTSRHNEPPEVLLRRFKRICAKEGIFREVKKRRFYEKPSEMRRRKQKEAEREVRRAERRRKRARTRSRSRSRR